MENINQHSNIDQIVKYLSGELSASEADALMQWVNASDANRQQFSELKNSWNLLGETSANQEIDLSAEWAKLESSLIMEASPKGKKLSMISIMSIAASILLVLGLSFYSYQYFYTDLVSTALAQTSTFNLPDASEVSLNENSELVFQKAFNRQERRVTLKGEGFFKVKPNKERPFIVETSEIEVIVLGTSFNVKIDELSGAAEVTVAEGIVRVQPRNKPEDGIVITTGEKVVLTEETQKLSKEENEDPNYNAWKTHTLVFEDAKLSEIIKDLEAVYHKAFSIESDEIAAYTLSTTFDNKDLNTVLLILESTFDLCVEESDSLITLKKEACR